MPSLAVVNTETWQTLREDLVNEDSWLTIKAGNHAGLSGEGDLRVCASLSMQQCTSVAAQ